MRRIFASSPGKIRPLRTGTASRSSPPLRADRAAWQSSPDAGGSPGARFLYEIQERNMAVIEFVQNYDDLSTDQGYQFRFHCNHCGNGYQSTFVPNKLGMAGGFLRAAGGLFGGVLGNAGNSAYEIQRAVGGHAHDSALQDAVQEIKPLFVQC